MLKRTRESKKANMMNEGQNRRQCKGNSLHKHRAQLASPCYLIPKVKVLYCKTDDHAISRPSSARGRFWIFGGVGLGQY